LPRSAPNCGWQNQLERAFRDAYLLLDRRISLFLSLPLASLDVPALRRKLNEIGAS